jgi:hypothetical protein
VRDERRRESRRDGPEPDTDAPDEEDDHG